MWTQILWSLAKILAFCTVGFGLYAAYVIFYVPLKARRTYKNYPNVLVSDKFTPIFGDLTKANKDIDEGRVYYHNQREDGRQLEGKDLHLRIVGMEPFMIFVSNKAMEEFCKNLPTKIDKHEFIHGAGRLLGKAYSGNRSTKRVMMRKKLSVKLLSLNSSSKYIPSIIDSCKQFHSELTDGETVNFQNKMSYLTFLVFAKVIFGKDISYMINNEVDWVKEDGTVEKKKFYNHFLDLVTDLLEETYSPSIVFAPALSVYELTAWTKRNGDNIRHFLKAMRALFESSEDPESILYQLKQSELTEDEIFVDIIDFLAGGAETSSHVLVSTVYFLKKIPSIHQKILEELNAHGVDKEFFKNPPSEEDFLQKLSELEYLDCVVKETLRYDPTLPESLDYIATQNVTVCGVPIPKGMKVKVDMLGTHFCEDYWLDPFRYEPDRFNVETEFGKKQKELKGKNPYSRRSFLHGMRTCPGQTFAMLELKIIITYMMVYMDFEIPKEILDNDGVGFAMGTNIESPFTVCLKT